MAYDSCHRCQPTVPISPHALFQVHSRTALLFLVFETAWCLVLANKSEACHRGNQSLVILVRAQTQSSPLPLTEKPIQCTEQPLCGPESPSEAGAKAHDGRWGETRSRCGLFGASRTPGVFAAAEPSALAPVSHGFHTGFLSLMIALGFTKTQQRIGLSERYFVWSALIPGEFAVQRAPVHLSPYYFNFLSCCTEKKLSFCLSQSCSVWATTSSTGFSALVIQMQIPSNLMAEPLSLNDRESLWKYTSLCRREGFLSVHIIPWNQSELAGTMTDKQVLNQNLLASDSFAGFYSPAYTFSLLLSSLVALTASSGWNPYCGAAEGPETPGQPAASLGACEEQGGTEWSRLVTLYLVTTFTCKSATFLLMYKSIHFISKYKRKKLYCYLYFLFSSPQGIRGNIKTFLSGHLVAHGPVTDFRLPPKVDRGRRMKCISN